MYLYAFERKPKRQYIFWEEGDDPAQLERFAQENKVYELFFMGKTPFFSAKTELSFPADLKIESIKSIEIANSDLQDYSFLYCFPNVKELHLSSNVNKYQLNLHCLPNLRAAYISYWSKGIEGLFDHKKLKTLHLGEYGGAKLNIPSQNKVLTQLAIHDSKVEDISDCVNLVNLKHLYLELLPRLKDISWVTALKKLVDLDFTYCKKIADLIPTIGELEQLQELGFFDMGEIESIKEVKNLVNLKKIRIIGNTKIRDGKVAFLFSMEKLKKIDARSYKHYDEKSLSW